MSADVRFHNDTSLGLNGFRLGPKNGNAIRVWNPLVGAIVTFNVPNVGIQGVVSNCVIDDMPGQSMPYYVIHVAFLKLDANGTPYINWLPWALAGTALSSEGFTVDQRTGKGHIVGMAIRVATFEIQGQYNSEYLVSYYNRGECSFFSTPAGSVSVGQGWKPIGPPVEILIWEDDWPKISAMIMATCDVANASLKAGLVPNGDLTKGIYASNTSDVVIGNPAEIVIDFPTPPINPGFYSYQLYINTNAGTMTLGAANNSIINVHGKF